jgi:hypothetical protein
MEYPKWYTDWVDEILEQEEEKEIRELTEMEKYYD